MAYARRGYGRSSSPRPARWMELRYAGVCAECSTALPAGARAFYDPADRSVCCTEIACAEAHGVTEEVWQGSPTSGGYVVRLAETRMRASGENAWARGQVSVARFSSGATAFVNRNGRCIDAPCCGCCS